jgi:hypothetical protein
MVDHFHDVPSACRDAVVLIASQLATNAVVHARRPYRVELHVGDVVRIEVTDSAAGSFIVSVPPHEENGWVCSSCRRWVPGGASTGATGARWWCGAEVSLEGVE